MGEDMRFDRSVSEALLGMLSGGAGSRLAERAREQGHKPLFDLQLRSEPKGTASWATLYYGMTALLNMRERGGQQPRQVKVGSSLDSIAVDIGGRLALIEAKADTASAGELAKVAVQAGVYAAMFADLLRERTQETLAAIERMLEQRMALGLSRPGVLHLREQGQVVPVVAIGPGRPSVEVHRRMWQVARAVADAGDARSDPMEVWYLDRAGRIAEVERWEDLDRAEGRR